MNRARCFALVWVVGVVAIGCSSNSNGRVQTTSQAIQGGKDDGPAHPFALGLCATNSGPGQCSFLCSAALIAPNLVLTARHCVAQTPQSINCSTSKFGNINGGPGNYWVTTHHFLFQQSLGWHQAKQIIVTPNGNAVCGNDMALIILKDNISANEAPTVTPVVQYPMTDHSRYSTTVTAIGYGNTGVSGGSGTRRIKENINLQCIPGDKNIDCGMQNYVLENEFLSGDGTCSGDSGSSAYEQKAFNNAQWISFGVLSRGGEQGGKCVGGVYTRTDKWASWIIQVAQQAAMQGNYPAPSWTHPPPMVGDGGDGGGPTPGQGQVGDPCGDNIDCASPLVCQSKADGEQSICTNACADDSECPEGYACSSNGVDNYCFPKPPPPPMPEAGPQTSNNNSEQKLVAGCAMAADPTKPVPWKSGAVAAMLGALVLLARRRRTG